ncbi:MAG: hypothetical protein ACYCXK_11685 [Candidatus Humimicrobiaceae bacterium]
MRIISILRHEININSMSVIKIHALKDLKKTQGNLSILMAVSMLAAALIFFSLFDIFTLYTAREHTKSASDAIVLAAAQNLLFFNEDEIIAMADETGRKNECEIDSIEFDYDKITVTTCKKVNFMFAGKVLRKSGIVYSTSKAKVIYPWDERFKNCDFFIFEF